MATKIDQKEYLKRYLSNDKDKKKKKKKEKKAVAKANVRIIDDDLDLSKLQSIQEDEVDMFGLGEEAPQVVGIIDERPPEMRAKEDFGSNKWKVVAAHDGFDTTLEVRDVSKRKDGGEKNFNIRDPKNAASSGSTVRRTRQDSDESPLRRVSRKDSDESPPRKLSSVNLAKNGKNNYDGPSRRRRDSDGSPPRRDRDRQRKDSDESPPRRQRVEEKKSDRERQRRDSDESPPRRQRDEEKKSNRNRQRKDSDESPPRRQRVEEKKLDRGRQRQDSDASPPRRQRVEEKKSDQGRHRQDSDESPPRKQRVADKKSERGRQRQDSDESPPRRNRVEGKQSDRGKHRVDSDESPPRRQSGKSGDRDNAGKRESDKNRDRRLSSARFRRSDSNESPPRKSRTDNSFREHRNCEDSDQSPPRRRKGNPSANQPRRETERDSRNRGTRRGSDESPPRRKLHGSQDSSSRRSPTQSNRGSSPGPSVRAKQAKDCSDSDLSPPRKSGRSGRCDSDESPPRRRRADPPVRVKEERTSSVDESPSRDTATGRMTKTLEGKRAGLQDARALREENAKHKRREAEAFEKMAVEHTGRFAETVVRQKSGRRKDIEKELREEFEKRKHEEKKKEIYTRWGKGVKQVEEYNARLQEAAHEMDKPLARYADDKDLDEHLKQQEREGDPMLEYLRSKRKEDNRRAGIPEKPTYQGAFPDNRYGIRPGYRWDGVDRSNGFEKRWFETMSRKKATEEEAYKYSVEDM